MSQYLFKLIRSTAGGLALMSLTLSLSVPEALADGVGLFIGGAVQYGQLDQDFKLEDADDIKAVFDDKDVGFNLGVGWRFNKWLAVDAGYWDFGTFKSDALKTGDKIDLDTTSYTVGGIFSVPLWIFDVYARGGAAFWDADSSELDNDGTDPYYGIGGAFNFLGSTDFYLEWVRFDLDTDIDTFSLGVRFTF